MLVLLSAVSMTIFFCLIPLGRRDGILNPILNTINRVEYKVNESHLGNENFLLVQENLGKEGNSVETPSAPLVLILKAVECTSPRLWMSQENSKLSRLRVRNDELELILI